MGSPSLNRIAIGLASALFCWMVFMVPHTEGRTETDKIEILVIGTGKITGENIAAARKAAIAEALKKGVEEYLARYLGSQGMINNFPRLIHDVIPESGDEIENFHILTEERHDKDYKVLVRIGINEKLMEQKLKETGIILMEGPPIKLLFMVSQKDPVGGGISYWWNDPENGSTGLTSLELILHRVFQERGFSPVNRLSSVQEEKLTPEMKRLKLSDEDAVMWGELLFSAKVISLKIKWWAST
jgi:hypothetical protein